MLSPASVPAVLFVAVLAAWTTNCATAARPSRSATVLPPPSLFADDLVDEGCYVCLQEAFRFYEFTGSIDKQFSTALLLAMREKELGLGATSWIDRARQLSTPDNALYIDIVSAQPWTTVATASDFDVPRARLETVLEWLAFLTRPGSGAVLDRYLRLALVCSRPGTAGAPEDVAAETPLLQYRFGLCGPAQGQQLDSVFAASPRFVEAGFFLARYEMVNGTAQQRITRALPLLTDAHTAIPESPVITVTLASVWRVRNEFARALALFDEALAIRPTQPDALLGRTMTLTYLGRGDAAIETATQMIELGTWYLGDAYYWRAWNLYQRGQLDAAAADVGSAKEFQGSGDLLTLSGMVAYDQQRRADARRDFDAARAMNPMTNCPALWYLGLIDLDERMMPRARDQFATASGCYASAAANAREEMSNLAPDLSPEALEQQRRELERRVADNLRQEARAALNASLLSQQMGDGESAEKYARVAVGHELTRERAQAVLDRAQGPSTGSLP